MPRTFGRSNSDDLAKLYGYSAGDFDQELSTKISIQEVKTRIKLDRRVLSYDEILENFLIYNRLSQTNRAIIDKNLTQDQINVLTQMAQPVAVASVEETILPDATENLTATEVYTDDPTLLEAVETLETNKPETGVEEVPEVQTRDVQRQEDAVFDDTRDVFQLGSPASLDELIRNGQEIVTSKILNSGTREEQISNIQSLTTNVLNYAELNFPDELTP